MKKFTNLLLGAVAVTFIGCGSGGTTPQGAVGSGYNNTFGGKDIAGIWNVYNASSYIDKNNPTLRFELDENGKLYNVPLANVQKQQLAEYQLVSDQELKIISRNGTAVAQFTGAYQEDNNCFYANSRANDKVGKELWCKQTNNSTYIPDVVQDGAEPDAVGSDFLFKDFRYPYATITTGIKSTEEVFAYNVKNDGSITQELFTKEFRNILANNVTKIIEKHNNVEDQTDEIYSGSIISIDAGDSNQFETYPAKVTPNMNFDSVTYNGITLECAIKRITKGINLKPLILTEMQTDMESKVISYSKPNLFSYRNNTIHVHCDTSDGDTLDEYYVDAYGSVLSISKFANNTKRYEILNKLSIGN